MNTLSPLKKWLLVTIITLVIVLLASYLFFRHEIDQSLGGNTEVVDVSQFETISGLFAISNVNVLSADSKTMLPNQMVLIRGNKILSVGHKLFVPSNYKLIDGSGKYLIPGLIDSHVHIKKSKNDFLLYIANGITQIGEMTGMEQHFDYFEQIKNGAIGPMMFISSPKITSQQGMKIFFRSNFEKRHQNFLSAHEGRKAVRKFMSMGYDAIKLSSDLEANIYYAINDEAQKLGVPVIGHLPVGLQLTDLYQSGQSQLSHIDSITHNLMNEFGGLSSNNSEAFLAYVRQQADAIAIKFKENNIALASTVWLHKTRPMQSADLTGFFKTIELEYQVPGWLEGSLISRGCLPGDNAYEDRHITDAEGMLAANVYYQSYNEAIKIITRALVAQNVSILAGTDALGACGMIAGFSLHKELETLNDLGLTNAQVLQSATLVPAIWMGINTGKIEANYRADLVLLDKNPLENIRNTKSINAVITNGKYLSRTQLDRMLKAVKDANNNSRKVNIDKYIK
jgi:hypothetical protein